VASLVQGLALADPTPLTEREAVERTTAHNPTVQAAVSDARKSAQTARAEAARYRPSLLVDATGTSQATPSLDIGTGTTRTTSRSLVFGAQVNQTFSFGTSLSLRVENRELDSQSPSYVDSSSTLSYGPGYGLSALLTLTQPLLRGFGDTAGLAELRTALINRRLDERVRDATASQAVSTTLQDYWELWYAQRALDIQRQALALARQQLDEARAKQKAGSIAELDVLSSETTVAEREQDVLAAEITVRQQQVELSRATGAGAGVAASLDVSAADPPEARRHLASDVQRAAEEASYSLAEQRLSLEAAQNTLLTAAESTRPRLDVQAWLKTDGLGNQSITPALEQLGRSSNVSANVGLVFELPLSSERHSAQQQSAEFAVRAATERVEAAKQQVLADAAAELATLEQAQQTVELARRSAEVSMRNAIAQRRRLANGSAIPVEVREAEDSLRRAQLSVERARVNAVQAEVRLGHFTGELLARWSL
jgi:outer membrane protein TolC